MVELAAWGWALLVALVSPFAAGAAQRGRARGELAELERRLADESPRTRAGAVREAARRGGREHWELVLRALADREAEVADAAQLALGELEDPLFAAEELLGRGGLGAADDLVRERAAEALGRLRVELDAGELARRLDLRPERAARLLVWSVERLARAGNLRGDVERLARALVPVAGSRRDAALAADALLALEALARLGALETPELARLAADARKSPEPELRVAALEVGLRAPLREGELWAAHLAGDREVCVRLQAAECLERSGTRAGAAVLVERLEEERRAGVRERVLAALQSISGYKYRYDLPSWRHWLAQCPPDWSRASRVAAAEAAGDAARQGTRAAVLELEAHGDRVAFLFDFSGSMWQPLPDGRTPKEVVELELREALEGLPEDTEFNLVPYNQEPHPWQDSVVPASRPNVRSALDFFERLQLHGRGNVWDALCLALADPDVDDLVVLTDGYPTGGTHMDMELIAPLFGHANRYRKVRLDAVLVDANPRGAAQWSSLAASTGGTCLEVALH